VEWLLEVETGEQFGVRGGLPGCFAAPGGNRPPCDRTTQVGEHEFGIEPLAHTQSPTRRAGPVGTVEAESPGLHFGDAGTAAGASELGAINPLEPLIVLFPFAELVHDLEHAMP